MKKKSKIKIENLKLNRKITKLIKTMIYGSNLMAFWISIIYLFVEYFKKSKLDLIIK
jgi:hypothetical protein